MYALIVESPAKSKTISKYLGWDFKVLASYGHVRALPTKKGSVDPNNNFNTIYDLTEQGVKILPQIIKELKNVKKLYLATDPDREGEAIAWHLLEALKEKKALPKDLEIHRVVFNEITRGAILKAVQNPREIDMNLVNAQRLRQALDYLVGFTLSPLLWKKLPGSRSAGRVQSVALRILCDRENEVDLFKPEEFWNILVKLQNEFGKVLNTSLISAYNKKLEKTDIKNIEAASKIVADISQSYFIVEEIKQKTMKRQPPLPFITSSLQQYASTNFHFGAKKTMLIAQRLYEGIEINGELSGLITYMRTDGIYIAAEALSNIRDFIKNNFEASYLPKKANNYNKKVKNAQEAHESIRPTNIELIPEKAKKFLDADQFKLYDAIWRRSVASQMTEAVTASETVNFISSCGNFLVSASYSKIIFDGFYKVYAPDKQESDLLAHQYIAEFFKNIKKGDKLNTAQIEPSQHYTEPPPRYSEAGLIKKMEELGIGRPSTYATIIAVLQDRAYAKINNRIFTPEERGRVVSAFLLIFCQKYVEYNFTAQLEDQLDKVADGSLIWKEVLSEFWSSFNHNIKEVENIPIHEVLESLNKLLEKFQLIKGLKDKIKIGSECPKCGKGKVKLNISRFGVFLGCSAYPECHLIINTNIATDNNDASQSQNNQNNNGTSLNKDPNINKNNSEKNNNMNNNKNNHENSNGSEAEYPYNDNVSLLQEYPKELIKDKVFLHKGPYGLYLKYNNKNVAMPKNANINELIANGTLMKIVELPKDLGNHPQDNNLIKLGIGPYGLYLLYNKKYYNLDLSQLDLSLEEAINIIDNPVNKKGGTAPVKILTKEGEDISSPEKTNKIEIYQGRYGYYVKDNGKNIGVAKDLSLENLTFASVLAEIEKKRESPASIKTTTKTKPVRKRKAT